MNTLEAQLEAFYVDAGLTDEELRAQLAPEGDAERWLAQAKIRIGAYARRTAVLYWAAGDRVIPLPGDCIELDGVEVDEGVLPSYDKWGLNLRLREAASSSGRATIFYSGYFAVSSESPDPYDDRAGLASVEYALSRFFRKTAASRADFRRYVTVTGQSGVEAQDLRDLADDHERLFDSLVDEISLGSPSTFYGE